MDNIATAAELISAAISERLAEKGACECFPCYQMELAFAMGELASALAEEAYDRGVDTGIEIGREVEE